MSSSGEQCFSGGLDGTIQCWNTPNPNVDPYDSYGIFHLCVTDPGTVGFGLTDGFFPPQTRLCCVAS